MGQCECSRCESDTGSCVPVEVLDSSESSRQNHRLRGVSVHHLGEGLLQGVHSVNLNRANSVRDIEPVFIRPRSANSKCPRDGRMGAAYVDCLSDSCAGVSNFMLSYTWDYSIGDIVDTLASFCKRRGLNAETTYIWICCLCVNQHRVQEMMAQGKFVSFEDLDATFGESVKAIGKIIAMMTPWIHPFYLNRVWCCYEIFRAIDWEVEVSIAMPPTEGEKFKDAARNATACSQAFACFRQIDVEAAQSFSPSDKTSILELVQSTLGIHKVNCVVKEYMQRWVLDRVVQVLSEVFDEGDVVLACRIYEDLLQFTGQVSFAFQGQTEWRKNMQQQLEKKGALHCTPLGVLCLYMRWIEELFANDYDSMESTIAQMAQARDRCDEYVDMCNNYIWIARGFLAMNRDGNYAEALKWFEKSCQCKVFDMETETVLNKLRLIGLCKKNMGDVDMALLDFEKTLTLRRKHSLDKSPWCALLLRNMGDALASRGDLQEACDKYEEALAIRTACGALQSTDGANLLKSIASLKEQLGDHEVAESSESRSTRISHRI